MVTVEDAFGTPGVRPSVGVMRHDIASPFLWAEAGRRVDVVVLVLPLINQVVSNKTVSPSTSVAAPGVQVRISLVVGAVGVRVALDNVGAVF